MTGGKSGGQSRQDATPEQGRQRLDKWLFVARIVRSRALAQTLIEAGGVDVNGRECRQSSQMLKPGDRIDIRLENRDLALVMLSAGERRGPSSEASGLYRDESAQSSGPGLTPFERAQRRLR